MEFNWAEDEAQASHQLADTLPQDTDHLDPQTGIRTIVTYRRDDRNRLVRTTRKLQTRTETKKIKRSVLARRQMPKFGNCSGVPHGELEQNITMPDNRVYRLDLTGERKEQKSNVEESLAKSLKGFVFKRTQEVRELGGENQPDSESRMRFKNVDDYPTVKVSNLSIYATEADVAYLFSAFGRVQRVKLAKDSITGQSRGYAFVSFLSKPQAQAAIRELNGHGYDSLILQVEMSMSAAEYARERLKREQEEAKQPQTQSQSGRRYRGNRRRY